MFSPYYFHVIISTGILKSNSLSLSTPSRTKWTLVYLLMRSVYDLYSMIRSLVVMHDSLEIMSLKKCLTVKQISKCSKQLSLSRLIPAHCVNCTKMQNAQVD